MSDGLVLPINVEMTGNGMKILDDVGRKQKQVLQEGIDLTRKYSQEQTTLSQKMELAGKGMTPNSKAFVEQMNLLVSQNTLLTTAQKEYLALTNNVKNHSAVLTAANAQLKQHNQLKTSGIDALSRYSSNLIKTTADVKNLSQAEHNALALQKELNRSRQSLAAALAKQNPEIQRNIKETVALRMAQSGASKSSGEFVGRLKALDQVTASSRAALAALGAGFGIYTSATIIAAGATFGFLTQLKQVISVGSEFSGELARVNAVMGTTASQLEVVKKVSLDLAASTQFMATEVANAFREMGMSGMSYQESIGSIRSVLSLAAVGMMDFGQATDIATNVMFGFGLASTELGKVVDVMANAVTNSNQDIKQLGNAMSYAAPVASSFGISLEMASAMTEVLANSGIKASRAGTTLRRTFINLFSDTENASAALAGLGVHVNTMAADMDQELLRVLKALNVATRGATENTGELAKTVGVYAAPGFMKLVAAANSSVDSLEEVYKASKNAEGAAYEMQKKIQDTIGVDWKIFLSAIQTVQQALFDLMNGPLREMIQTWTAWVQGLAKDEERIKALGNTVVNILKTVSALVAGIMLVSGAGLVVKGLMGASKAFQVIKTGLTEAGRAASNFDKAAAGINGTVSGLGAVGGVAIFGQMANGARELSGVIPDVVSSIRDMTQAQKVLSEYSGFGSLSKENEALAVRTAEIRQAIDLTKDQIKDEEEKLKLWEQIKARGGDVDGQIAQITQTLKGLREQTQGLEGDFASASLQLFNMEVAAKAIEKIKLDINIENVHARIAEATANLDLLKAKSAENSRVAPGTSGREASAALRQEINAQRESLAALVEEFKSLAAQMVGNAEATAILQQMAKRFSETASAGSAGTADLTEKLKRQQEQYFELADSIAKVRAEKIAELAMEGASDGERLKMVTATVAKMQEAVTAIQQQGQELAALKGQEAELLRLKDTATGLDADQAAQLEIIRSKLYDIERAKSHLSENQKEYSEAVGEQLKLQRSILETEIKQVEETGRLSNNLKETVDLYEKRKKSFELSGGSQHTDALMAQKVELEKIRDLSSDPVVKDAMIEQLSLLNELIAGRQEEQSWLLLTAAGLEGLAAAQQKYAEKAAGAVANLATEVQSFMDEAGRGAEVLAVRRAAEIAAADDQTKAVVALKHAFEDLTRAKEAAINKQKFAEELKEEVMALDDSVEILREFSDAGLLEGFLQGYDAEPILSEIDAIQQNTADAIFSMFTGLGDYTDSLAKRIEEAFNNITSKVTSATDAMRSALEGVGQPSGASVGQGSSVADPAMKGVLDFIGQYESKNDYGAVYHAYDKYFDELGKNLEEMSIAEILEMQKDMAAKTGSSPVGKYQYIRSTLAATATAAGIDFSEKFTSEVQDRLAASTVKSIGFDKWAAGLIDSKEFLKNLSGIWAAFPDPGSNKSAFAGILDNASLVSTEAAIKRLDSVRQGLQTGLADTEAGAAKVTSEIVKAVVGTEQLDSAVAILSSTAKSVDLDLKLDPAADSLTNYLSAIEQFDKRIKELQESRTEFAKELAESGRTASDVEIARYREQGDQLQLYIKKRADAQQLFDADARQRLLVGEQLSQQRKLEKDELQALEDEYDTVGSQTREYAAHQDKLGKLVYNNAMTQEEANKRLEEYRLEMVATKGPMAEYYASLKKGIQSFEGVAVDAIDMFRTNLIDSLMEGKLALGDFFEFFKRKLIEFAVNTIVVNIVGTAAGVGQPGSVAGAAGKSLDALSQAKSVGYLAQISKSLTSNSLGKAMSNAAMDLGARFGNASFPAGAYSKVAGLPNWQVGAAGLGGGLAGGFVASKMFEGEYVSIGSSIGSAVGAAAAPMIAAALGMGPVGWAGLAVGAFLGAIGGGGLGSLFGGNQEDPRINIGVKNGNFGVNSTNRWGMVDGGNGETARALESLNAQMWALAKELGPGAEAAMKSFQHAGQTLTKDNFEQWLNDVAAGMMRAMAQGVRNDAIAEAGSGVLAGIITDALNDAGDDPQAMLAAISAAKQIEKNLYKSVGGMLDAVGSEMFNDGGGLDLVATRIYQLAHASKAAGEGIDGAITRVLTGVDAGVTALKLIGNEAAGLSVQALYDMGERLAEVAGGYEALTAGMASYYDLFFSEEEKKADQIEAAQRATSRALGDLGISMPTSEEEFKKLISSLDLTTESGAKMFAMLTGLSEQFKLLFDAMKEGGSAIDPLLGTRTALRDAASRFSDPAIDRKGAEGALAAAGFKGEFNSASIGEFLRALAETEDAGGAAGKALLEMVDALARAAAEADRIAQERKDLTMRELELSGTEAEILAAKRAAEMAATDKSNQAILKRIYLLEDEAKAAADRAKIKEETDDLTMRYLEALGDDGLLKEFRRKKELEDTDPVNRALLEAIWALEDAARERAEHQQRVDELSGGLQDILKDVLENSGSPEEAAEKAAVAFEEYIRKKLIDDLITHISDAFSEMILDSFLGPFLDGFFDVIPIDMLANSAVEAASIDLAAATSSAAIQTNASMVAAANDITSSSIASANFTYGSSMAGVMMQNGGMMAGMMMQQGGMAAGLMVAQGGMMAAGAIQGVVQGIIDAIGDMIDLFNDPAFREAMGRLAGAFGELAGALRGALGGGAAAPAGSGGRGGGGGGGGSSAEDTLTEIADLLNSIRGVLDDRMPDTLEAKAASYEAAKRQLDLWVAAGVIPDADGFSRVVDALGNLEKTSFSSKEDYVREYWATSSSLKNLERLVGKQTDNYEEWTPAGAWEQEHSDRQEQIDVLKEQNDILKDLLAEQRAANLSIAKSSLKTAKKLDRLVTSGGTLEPAA